VYASGNQLVRANLEVIKDKVDALIPNLDEDGSAYGSLVLDASAAASYLLSICLGGGVEDAIWAGECARNAVDEWILTAGDTRSDGRLTPITIRPEEQAVLQKKVDSHRLMQREMRQQQMDIAYLREHGTLGPQECLRLRQSWSNGAKSNLDLE
jgi:hypothetical protein